MLQQCLRGRIMTTAIYKELRGMMLMDGLSLCTRHRLLMTTATELGHEETHILLKPKITVKFNCLIPHF